MLDSAAAINGGNVEQKTMKRIEFKPCGDRVLIRPFAPKGETERGGIIIPENAKEKPLEGVVVSVGRGKRIETGEVVPVQVRVGDEIVFAKYAGSEMKIDDIDYLVMHEDDIIGVLKEAPEAI